MLIHTKYLLSRLKGYSICYLLLVSEARSVGFFALFLLISTELIRERETESAVTGVIDTKILSLETDIRINRFRLEQVVAE